MTTEVRLVLEGLRKPVWVFDIEHESMHWANTAAVEFWGADSLPHLLERDWASDMSETSRMRLACDLARFREGRSTESRWTFYPEYAKREPITVISKCSGIWIDDGENEENEDQEKTARLAMLVDATPCSAEEIDHETTRLAEAVLHTTVRISLFSLDGELVMQNPASQRTYGTPEAQAATEGVPLFRRFADQKAAQVALDVVCKHGEFQGEFEMETDQGRRWHGLRMRRTPDPVSGQVCVLLNETDLTELKRAQQRVIEITKAGVERRMAGGFAHEVRNALTGADLSLSRLLSESDQDKPTDRMIEHLRAIFSQCDGSESSDSKEQILQHMAAINGYVETIERCVGLTRRAVRRTLDLTGEIMTISKQGHEEIRFDPFDVVELIRESIGTVQERANRSHIATELRLPSEPLELLGNDRHFRSIFDNLVFNAMDALEELEGRERRLSVSLNRGSSSIQVVVSDNGVGIAPNHLSQIFDPFFSTKAATGTGLGLGIARHYAEMYGGSLTATATAINPGATFTITWPNKIQEPPAAEDGRSGWTA